VQNTVVETVYVDQPSEPPRWRWLSAVTIATPILLSLASIIVAWLAFKSNREGLAVDVKRDVLAPIGIAEPFGIELDPSLERSDSALLAVWDISLVNTSLTAITPITDFRIFEIGFLGHGLIINPDNSGTALTMADGHKVELPIGIRPGEV
jgi:hypothetical protein